MKPDPYIVSIWIDKKYRKGKDALLDCGIKKYDVDRLESFKSRDSMLIPVRTLIEKLSFSESFVNEAVKKAKELGLSKGCVVTALYRTTHDPTKHKYSEDAPTFLGVFSFIV